MPRGLDAELFGVERATPADVRERRQGLMEISSGGTILFEEIGDLPAELQPKLQRVLETRTFRRVGGTRDVATDVRILAATQPRPRRRSGGGEIPGRPLLSPERDAGGAAARCASGHGKTDSR